MLANFVQEVANAPGTATTINLGGPPTGRRGFLAAFASGSTVYYFMDDGTQAEWGVGTVTSGTPNTLARTTVIGNTAGTTARLNFTGTVRVYNWLPAERVVALTPDAAAARATLGITDWLRLRNSIVNPAMQISQERGTAFVDCTTGSTYVIDQWIASLSTTPGGTLRVQQVASPTPAGSPFRLRATVQVADSSIAAGDRYVIEQPIEGQMIADARFGSASARQLLVPFGVRSSVAGTFGVSLNAGSRSWVGTISVGAGEVNTDLLRTLVIPGDTTGTWLTDTGAAFFVRLTLAAGTTWHGTAGWQNANVLTTAAQTNFMGTGGATFELFDVGLYVDTLGAGVFPPFEVPAFDEELRRCQRYYAETESTTRFSAGGASAAGETPVYHPAVMRVTPVVAIKTAGARTNAATVSVTALTSRVTRHFVQSTASGDTFSVGDVLTLNARL